MSKLKSHRILGMNEECARVENDYYLKSEADEVIAEKDEKIDELQKATDSAWSKVNAMYDELRHHKYKRCLDKAELCQWKAGIFIYKEEKSDFYYRWYERWLEVAEQFKETK